MNPLDTQQFKDKIDLQIREHMEANHIKDRLEKAGFSYTMSLYGVVFDANKQRHEYRRIEVFLSKPPRQVDAFGIKQFFDEFIPYNYYTIWAYNCDVQEIILIEGWD